MAGKNVSFGEVWGGAEAGGELPVPFPDSGGTSPIDMTGCVALYHLEGNANDTSGTGANGTLVSAPAVAGGKVGSSSYVFNGAAQYIHAPSAALPMGGDDRTICFWMMFDGTTLGRRMVLGYGNNASGEAFGLRIGNYSYGGVEAIGWGVFDGFDRFSVDPLAWTFIAATYGSNTLKLYKNGALAYTGTGTLNTTASPTAELRIGWGFDSTNDRFGGGIDEVAVWSRVLSDAEILAAYELQRWSKY